MIGTRRLERATELLRSVLPEEQREFVKSLATPFLRFVGKQKLARTFPDEPIIVGGCPRSGTTLLLSILGAHPHIAAFPTELGVFANWKRGDSDDEQFVPLMDLFYRYICFQRIPSEARRWCEKTPSNIGHFDKILDYFDERVRLIHIVRDGRDVTLSHHPNEPNEYWVKPERWIQDVRAGLEFLDHPNVFTVKYESLVEDFQTTSRLLCDFLGEEFVTEMAQFVENTNVRENAAWFGKVQSVHNRSVAKWKRSENQARLEEVMNTPGFAELLEELDYEV